MDSKTNQNYWQKCSILNKNRI